MFHHNQQDRLQPARYKMQEKMLSIGNDFYIEDSQGERVFYVDHKTLRIRKTILFKDMDGNELARIQEKLLGVRDSMKIYRGEEAIATVKKALIAPLRQRYIINITSGEDLVAQGNILNHEYTIHRDKNKVAEIAKRWFGLRDKYGVEVEPGEDDILILASTAVIDVLSNSEDRSQ